MRKFEDARVFYLPRVDMVLLSGDIANMVMNPQATQEEVAMSHKEMDTMVEAIAEINRNLYYVPGNVSFHCQHTRLSMY